MLDAVTITQLGIMVALIGFAPSFLYVSGRIKDPFHPLILVGGLFYFVSAHELLVNTSRHLDLMPAEPYKAYLLAAILSLLGVYAGWWLGLRRQRKLPPADPAPPLQPAPTPDLQVNLMLLAAFACAGIGASVHFIFYEQWELSGYLLDIQMLWITAAILSVQIFFLSPRHRPVAVFIFLLAISPPIDRFFVYGQRGDTFRLAVILEMAYLVRGRRPSKAVFITAVVLLGLTMATLSHTRDLVNKGEAPNRIAAVVKVIPTFFESNPVDAGEEALFGSASMKVTRRVGVYGFGRGITYNTLIHLLPRGLIPGKDALGWQPPGLDQHAITGFTGLKIGYGAAPSGVASGFFDFGWACPIPWIILGYFYQRLWSRAADPAHLLAHGLLAGYTIAILYGITQNINIAEVNMIYVMLPIFLLFRFTRRPRHADLPYPAEAGFGS